MIHISVLYLPAIILRIGPYFNLTVDKVRLGVKDAGEMGKEWTVFRE